MKIINVADEDIFRFKKLDPLFMFGRTSICNRIVLGGLENNDGIDEPVALMICEQVQDRVIVQWLFVDEAFRGQGRGQAMLDKLIELSKKAGITRVESYFLDTNVRHQITPDDDYYFMEYGFLNKRNLAGEWLTDVKTLLDRPGYDGTFNKELVPLNMLSKVKINKALEEIVNNSSTTYLYGYDKNFLKCDEDMSCVLMDDKGKIYGALLLDAKVDLIFPIAFLAENSDDARDMAYACLQAAKKKYDKDTSVCVQLVNESTRRLVEKMLPEQGVSNYVLYSDMKRFENAGYEHAMWTAIHYDFWNKSTQDHETLKLETFLKKGEEKAISIEELSKRSIISKAVIKDEISGLGQMDARQIYDVLVSCRYEDCYGVFDDLPSKPTLTWFDPDLSCYLERDGELIAILLVNITNDKNLFPLLMYANNKDNTKYLLALIKKMCDRAMEKYPQDTKVVLRCYDELSRQMSEQVFGAK